MTQAAPLPPLLEQASPPAYVPEADGADGPGWRVFQFNFNADPKLPPWGELAQVGEAQIGFSITGHFIGYHVNEDSARFDVDNVVKLADPIHLLTLSTTNSAHSMSELMSFILFYRQHGGGLRIGVNEHVIRRLPFLYEFLRLCIPADRLIVMHAEKRYQAPRMWLRRNVHMNMVNNFTSIDFWQDGNLLVFDDLLTMAPKFIEDPTPFLETVRHVAEAYALSHELPERVMLVKTADDAGATTPGRAMEIPPEVKARAEAAGIRVMSIGDFTGIDHYLATIYAAKVFITSYGGPACTNRFFCNRDARVILMANKHYQWEYEYPSEGGPHWHIRHSHLFPVRQQLVVLDHANIMTAEDVDQIAGMCEQGAAGYRAPTAVG